MDEDPLIAELRRRVADPSVSTDHAGSFRQTAGSPLEDQAVSRAETILGRRLPALLRDLYLRVANGGIGPGYGLLPLVSSGTGDSETVVELYTAFRSTDPEDPAWSWPPDLLPFCDWGCSIRSCVDCSSPLSSVVTFDPNVRGIGEPMSDALARTHTSLRAWFTDWTAGVNIWNIMFEPDPSQATAGINPFTRKPFTIIATRLRRS